MEESCQEEALQDEDDPFLKKNLWFPKIYFMQSESSLTRLVCLVAGRNFISYHLICI